MKSTRSTLRLEPLETRNLMAADVHFHLSHNFVSPEDVDANGSVSAIDALVVINALNSGSSSSLAMLDVNADGYLSPLDALTVINNLNASRGGDQSSRVSPEARIARIEAALASGEFPANLNAEEASQILLTLQLGGAPELGDCLKGDAPDDTQEFLTRLADKLSDAEIDTETIDKVISEIQSQIDAGETDIRTVVDSVLAENGIDLKALRETHREEERIERVTDKLTQAGIDQAIVDQISTEMTDALKAGTPLTQEQLVARLTELGIDPSTIFSYPKPSENRNQHTGGVTAEEVQSKLEELGVEESIVTTIVGEILAAEEAGSPLTRRDVFVRLHELGVVLGDGVHGSRPHAGRRQ